MRTNSDLKKVSPWYNLLFQGGTPLLYLNTNQLCLDSDEEHSEKDVTEEQHEDLMVADPDDVEDQPDGMPPEVVSVYKIKSMASCLKPTVLKDSDLVVPCGYCLACLQRRRTDWTIRLKNELRYSTYAHFITLTYAENLLPLGKDDLPTLYKPDLYAFHKTLKFWNSNYDPEKKVTTRKRQKHDPVKYYSIGEYGSKYARPHYHSIMFNIRPEVAMQMHRIWKNGQIKIGTVTDASIHYVTGYVLEKNEYIRGTQKPFGSMSKGLGAKYLDKNSKFHNLGTLNDYYRNNGHKITLPRYYRDKLFNDEQKSVLNDLATTRSHDRADSQLKEYEETGIKMPYHVYRQQQIDQYNEKIKRKQKQKKL